LLNIRHIRVLTKVSKRGWFQRFEWLRSAAVRIPVKVIG
jgi:hypothetical protein